MAKSGKLHRKNPKKVTRRELTQEKISSNIMRFNDTSMQRDFTDIFLINERDS